jgi:hypothetical protein
MDMIFDKLLVVTYDDETEEYINPTLIESMKPVTKFGPNVKTLVQMHSGRIIKVVDDFDGLTRNWSYLLK